MIGRYINRQSMELYRNYFLVIVIFSIMSIPLIQFGYIGDDVFNSQIKGILQVGDATLYLYLKNTMLAWIHSGRLYPLSVLSVYPIFYAVGNSYILYNVVHFFSLIVSVYVSYLFFSKLSLNKKTDLIVYLALFPLSWSLFPTSVLTSYALLMPQVTLFIMLTFIFYINFILTSKTRYLVGIVFFYTLALLTYEVAVVVFPIALMLNKYFTGSYLGRKRFKLFSVVFLVTLLYVSATFFLRIHYGVGYSGTEVGSSGGFFVAFIKQFCGVLPLVYFFHTSLSIWHLSAGYFLLSAILMISSFNVYNGFLHEVTPVFRYKLLFMVGLVLQAVPAALVAMTQKYQGWLTFGVSHIPVLLQQTGFCIFMFSFLSYVKLKTIGLSRERFIRLSIVGIMAFVMGLLFLANQSVTKKYNEEATYSRDIYKKALRSGIFHNLPSHAIVLRPKYLAFENVSNSIAFRAQTINRSDILLYNIKGEAPFMDKKTEPEFKARFFDPKEKRVYFLEYSLLSRDSQSGFVMLGYVNKRVKVHGKFLFKLDKIKLFYIAQSRSDLKKIVNLLSIKYSLNKNTFKNLYQTMQQHGLSGLIDFPVTTVTIVL